MTHTSHRRAVRAASQAKYQQNLRIRRSPRSEDIARAVLHSLRDTLGQIVNISSISGKQVVENILRRTNDELIGRGFDRSEVSKAAKRSLSKPAAPSAS